MKVRKDLNKEGTFKLRCGRQDANQEEKCSRQINSKGKTPEVESFMCLQI